MNEQAMHASVKGFLDGLLGMAGFDVKVFANHPKLRSGIADIATAAKDSASAPFNLDDVLIDQLVAVLSGVLDQYKAMPHTVGAAPGTPGHLVSKRYHTEKQVRDAIVANGGDQTKFAPWLLVLLQYAPDLIALIMKLLGK